MTCNSTTKKFLNPNLTTLQPYVPGEQTQENVFIKLNTNENPFGPSPNVLKTIKEFLNLSGQSLRLYPEPESDSLRNALAKRYSCKKENIFVGNGSDEVLSLCFLAFFANRGLLSFPKLTYSFYPSIANLFNIPYERFPLNENFELDLNKIPSEATSVIFPNPNALTGIILKRKTIEETLQKNHQKLFIIDEAYADFSDQSCVDLVNKYDNLLITQTFSKSRSLAGLRIGFSFGNEKLIEALTSVKNSFNSYPVDKIASMAATSALENDEWYKDKIKQIKTNKNFLSSELQNLGFRVLPSSANFILITHNDYSGLELKNTLMRDKILVRHFEHQDISNWIRVTIGTLDECTSVLDCLKRKIA